VDAVLQNPGALAPAAEAAGTTVQKLGPFSREAAQGLAASPAVKRAAFSEALVQDGTVSDPIEVSPGHNVWIRVTDHMPEQAQPLAKVRDSVVAAVRADRTRKAAIKRADALLAQVTGGETLAEVATAASLPAPQSVPGVPRGAPLVDESVSEAIFVAAVPAEGKVTPGRQVLADGTTVLFTVDKVVPGNAAELPPQQLEQLQQQLAQIAGSDEAAALVAAMRKDVKVNVIEQNL